MTFATATEVVDVLAALGPFFAVHAHGPGEPPEAPWRHVTELTRPSVALRGRVRVVRAALAEQAGHDVEEVELRVAASIAHLGLVARLAAPAIAVMVADYRVDLRPGGMWWQDAIGGPMPLCVPAWANRARDNGTAAPAQLIDDVVAPLTAALAELVSISQRVLWGNVASAVNGAAPQIARQRPEFARQAWLTATAAFQHRGLSRERTPPGPAFCRSSCCLRYRLIPGTDDLCGDCVLTRHAVWSTLPHARSMSGEILACQPRCPQLG
jgi:hypothetical protein